MRPRPRERRRLVVRVLPALIAAPLLAVTAGAPALACSCAGQDLQQSLDQADVVFAGEVLRRTEPRRWGSSADRATYVVEVDRVYKGEASAVQEVVTVASGATCGLELPSSGPALLFAGRGAVEFLDLEPGPGQLTATLCGGSRVGSDAPASFGPGRPPTSSDVTATAGGSPSALDGLASVAGAVGVPAVVGVAAAVGLAGALGLARLRARRRRHD